MIAVVLLLASQAAAAWAQPPPSSTRYCHAVGPITEDELIPARGDFSCEGQPTDYQAKRLWLYAPIAPENVSSEGATLLVHQTRFDRLAVFFGYADGSTVRHSVRAGAFGANWRVGGQLAFAAPRREAKLVSMTISVDGLDDYSLLRTRVMSAASAARDAALAASLVGGALTLLALSTCYNMLLARASRQRFVIWHAAWVGSILVWGLLWSQLALLAIPGIAGTLAARMCTLLATLAIAFAAACAATCPEPGTAPRWARRMVTWLGIAVVALGAPIALGPPVLIQFIGPPLNVAVLAVLAAATLLILLSWRRGSSEARAFFFAWSVPMLALAATQIFDMGTALFGGGPQIAVLLACALQTVWLSVGTTMRLARFRMERDAAQAAQAELRELTQRDPLTGLLNRRGFTERMEKALTQSHDGDAPFALLLVDVDHFKAINDRFGHDAGDGVLQRIGARLAALEGDSVFVARIGGEEFALGVRDLAHADLARYADDVRMALNRLRFADLLGEPVEVSVSVGIAEAGKGARFQTLYRSADKALYAVKNAGRNGVARFRLGQAEILSRGHMRAA
ncbi:diguanylate cyclase [Allosphingosinicella humi]